MIGKVGTTELILILLIVLIIFGVGKLSQVGGALGSAIRDFRKATKDGAEPVDEAVENIDQSDKPQA